MGRRRHPWLCCMGPRSRGDAAGDDGLAVASTATGRRSLTGATSEHPGSVTAVRGFMIRGALVGRCGRRGRKCFTVDILQRLRDDPWFQPLLVPRPHPGPSSQLPSPGTKIAIIVVHIHGPLIITAHSFYYFILIVVVVIIIKLNFSAGAGVGRGISICATTRLTTWVSRQQLASQSQGRGQKSAGCALILRRARPW